LQVSEAQVSAAKLKKQNWWMTALQLKVKTMISEKLEQEKALRLELEAKT